ncbi:MAG: COG4315 family predicted lipoprotein [Marmoricola sp.]
MDAGSRRRAAMLALPAFALVVAACGSGSSGSQGGSGGSGPVTISTGSSSGTTYLTDGSGRAVYLWAAEQGQPLCSGACAGAWPPVTTTGKPGTSGKAVASDVGTVKRDDGSRQVTYDGHPLYYYAQDGGPGSTSGEGSNGFGAKWWLLAPSGSAVTALKGGGSSGSGGGGGY